MKGLITGVVTLLIAGGVTFGVVANGSEETKNEGETVVTANEVVSEEITKRTVDLKGNLPWEYAPTNMIEDWIAEGEVVFLYEDKESLEADMDEMQASDNENKSDHMASYKRYLDLYAQQMERDYPERTEEVQQLVNKY